MECKCGKIFIGKEIAGTNWKENCPEHGTHTEWYESFGKQQFENTRKESIRLQKLAKEARNAAEK